ncbi:MAG: hypothetical protein IB618_02270 [Candidatus Pacearchaeota archaeon]|nr:MAG: hypothetical protein IB618_02270 [Candidatus Pacearchaeota archaeon]
MSDLVKYVTGAIVGAIVGGVIVYNIAVPPYQNKINEQQYQISAYKDSLKRVELEKKQEELQKEIDAVVEKVERALGEKIK